MSLILIAFIFNGHTAQKREIKVAGAKDQIKDHHEMKKPACITQLLHIVIVLQKSVRTDGSPLQLEANIK